MSLTKVSHSMITGSELNLLDYGADPTGTVDSTTAVQAWLDDLYANSASGYAPQGTYLTSGASITYSASKKFSIRGSAMGGTVFKKFGSSTEPVFKFRISSGNYLELNLSLSDFEVDGNSVANVNGLDFNAAGLVTISRVRCVRCAVGLEGKGLLVSSFYDTDFSGNKYGARFSRGTGGSQPFANLLNFYNCRFNGNTDWGFYFGQGSSLLIKGCNLESNGLAGNLSTGGMFIDSTIDDETGFASIDIQGTWFESNKGHTFLMNNATNALLKLDTVSVYSQEGTKAITIGAIRSASFVNVLAPSTNAELVCEAEIQNFIGNVLVYEVNLAGAVQIVGSYKTAVIPGTDWSATAATVGTLNTTVTAKAPRLELTDGVAEPTTIPGKAILFVDIVSGDLKIKFGDGTTKTIVTDT